MQDTTVVTDTLSVKVNSVHSGLSLNEGTATPQAVATGTAAILLPPGQPIVRITAAAATTGASLPVGSFNGQIIIIELSTAAANTVTFAAAGTSNVAGGAAVSMAGLAAHMFMWDATLLLWFQIGPLAN